MRHHRRIAFASVILAGLVAGLSFRLGQFSSSTRSILPLPSRAAPPHLPASPRTTASSQAPTDQDAFPPPSLPEIVTEPLIKASLALLQKNGADLTKPMPSHHRVLATSLEVSAQIAAWARTHGFEARAPQRYFEHGGEERFLVDLVRTEVPDPGLIRRQGEAVLAAVNRTPGSSYQTWQGEIVR